MTQDIIDSILNWDFATFYWIHIKCANSFFDFIMPLFRNPFFWSPLYLYLGVFMFLNFDKKGIIWSLFYLSTFAISDFLCASVLKPMFHRIRPCVDPMWFGVHRQIVNASTGFSFPSNHAANHFALAVFMIVTMQPFIKNIKIYAILWAATISFAQVYVGVHYPIDIIFGALLGTWIGYFTGNYFNLRNYLQ